MDAAGLSILLAELEAELPPRAPISAARSARSSTGPPAEGTHAGTRLNHDRRPNCNKKAAPEKPGRLLVTC